MKLPRMILSSSGAFLLEKSRFPRLLSWDKSLKNGTLAPRKDFQRKMKKSQKVTEIYFAETSPVIDILTYNTDLKRRLTRYAERHPDLCHQTDDDGLGGLRFEIQKGRFCFRLTEPYSDERRQAASRYAMEHKSVQRIIDSLNQK